MLQLQKGTYFGIQNKAIHLDGLIITDTEYTHDKVDWHTHQNPYFTFMLTGNMQETNKKESYECSAGTLLFHNWQDAHYNIKHPGYARGFHIELEKNFFDRYQLPLAQMEGSLKLDNPVLKLLFRNIYVESKHAADIEIFSIHESLFKIFGLLTNNKCRDTGMQPAWVKKIKEVLNDSDATTLSWDILAAIAQIHPVHLSRGFPKYFNTTVGDYLKKLRIEKAAALLAQADVSVTQVGYTCAFADQSHFIRSFKQMVGVTPLQYRKIIAAR